MGVTADLSLESRARSPGQVAGHDQRRPPIERERRHQHPPVADRYQLGHPRDGLTLEQLDGIGSEGSGREGGVARPWHLAASRLAAGFALHDRQVRHHLAVLNAHARREGLGLVYLVLHVHALHRSSLLDYLSHRDRRAPLKHTCPRR